MLRLKILLTVFLLLSCAVQASGQLKADSPELKVILLGTGYPRPSPERAGPSTAVVFGEKYFIVDAGRGIMMRIASTDLDKKQLAGVFLTHLHSDHISGLPDLFNTTWVIHRRKVPLELYGPRGVNGVGKAITEFYKEDIHIRRDLTEMLAAAGAKINTHTVNEGVVYQDGDVKVTAFLVAHEPVKPAFGYRFDVKGKSVVISGDTTFSENLVKHSRGADVLVHEAYLPEHFDKYDKPEVAERLRRYHATGEQAGRAAQEAGVKLLVLSHLVPGESENTYLERAAKTFSGKIVVGRDLMTF
ncbi:MAG: MBL fold metallo-hydrolase [Acidobacteriales bacterium]|nr:MBL fold metallo-hydrolase [Terriglobales bacterium]